MRILNIEQTTKISAGAVAFCAFTLNGELLCTQVIWNGFQHVPVGNPQFLPVVWVNGAATFYV